MTVVTFYHAAIFYEGQPGFVVRVRPTRREPLYFHCERTGFRVRYPQLVRDGETGAYVEQGWEDPPHPQRFPIEVAADSLPSGPQAPPQDENDETPVVTLVIDGVSYPG